MVPLRAIYIYIYIYIYVCAVQSCTMPLIYSNVINDAPFPSVCLSIGLILILDNAVPVVLSIYDTE
jgi:hypothetical protein